TSPGGCQSAAVEVATATASAATSSTPSPPSSSVDRFDISGHSVNPGATPNFGGAGGATPGRREPPGRPMRRKSTLPRSPTPPQESPRAEEPRGPHGPLERCAPQDGDHGVGGVWWG